MIDVLLYDSDDFMQNATQILLTTTGLAKVAGQISPGRAVYVQDSPPAVSPGVPYVWIDTSNGDLQFWVEDGL